ASAIAPETASNAVLLKCPGRSRDFMTALPLTLLHDELPCEFCRKYRSGRCCHSSRGQSRHRMDEDCWPSVLQPTLCAQYANIRIVVREQQSRFPAALCCAPR